MHVASACMLACWLMAYDSAHACAGSKEGERYRAGDRGRQRERERVSTRGGRSEAGRQTACLRMCIPIDACIDPIVVDSNMQVLAQVPSTSTFES